MNFASHSLLIWSGAMNTQSLWPGPTFYNQRNVHLTTLTFAIHRKRFYQSEKENGTFTTYQSASAVQATKFFSLRESALKETRSITSVREIKCSVVIAFGSLLRFDLGTLLKGDRSKFIHFPKFKFLFRVIVFTRYTFSAKWITLLRKF